MQEIFYFTKNSNANYNEETQFKHACNNDSDKVMLMANTQLAQDKTNV